ncbi:MAG: type II toxin-antitoxin system RelE/ParE family toxin [Deltaproteobacteria bacterium]|nr:type II toxin-antitoxin system RelE/ParE family toxin [Deltaproteobacteria bacterium]
MRIFKTKWFMRYARQERIEDISLHEAIERADRGLVDADLGAGLIKQRIPRRGQGRAGGYRSLIAYRSGERAVFLYGFAKNERDNIENNELETLREMADGWLKATEAHLEQAMKEGKLHEAIYDYDERQEA